MPYRATWRLVGAGQRVLSRGDLDGVHEGHGEAVSEILSQLQSFAVVGRDEQRNEWWGRRAADADIEMRFRVEERAATRS
jgi:hypothetical protein